MTVCTYVSFYVYAYNNNNNNNGYIQSLYNALYNILKITLKHKDYKQLDYQVRKAETIRLVYPFFLESSNVLKFLMLTGRLFYASVTVRNATCLLYS